MDDWPSRSRLDEFRFRLVDPFTLQEVGDVDCYPRGSALTWGYYTDNILQGSLSVSGSVERDGVTCMVRVYDRVTIGDEAEEFCLGTLFADQAPTAYKFGRQSANLSCYSALWRFTQDVLISDFSRDTGYGVVQAIRDVVEADGGHLVVGDGVDTARGFGNPIFFEIGEKRSTVINTMAGWIGCQIAIDEWGDITIAPYVEPSRRPIAHEFVEGDGCELTAGATLSSEASNPINRVIMYFSRDEDPGDGLPLTDRVMLASDPGERLSFERCGRRRSEVVKVDQACTHAELEQQARTYLAENSGSTTLLDVTGVGIPTLRVGDVVTYTNTLDFPEPYTCTAMVKDMEIPALCPGLTTNYTLKVIG